MRAPARLIALAVLVTFSAATPAAVPKLLPPIDQCRGDKSFDRFRAELRRAVEHKNQNALLALLAPDVVVNTGEVTGPAAFIDQWNFEPDDPQGIWPLLETILKLGCARDGAARVIPSLDIQMGAYVDEMREVVLILPGAKLYAEAGIEHAKPETVPWTIAAVTSRAGDFFTGVRLPDGREGLISDDELYEPMGYRMVIKKSGGRWLITAFVAID